MRYEDDEVTRSLLGYGSMDKRCPEGSKENQHYER